MGRHTYPPVSLRTPNMTTLDMLMLMGLLFTARFKQGTVPGMQRRSP
jgi:hypothetical protein